MLATNAIEITREVHDYLVITVNDQTLSNTMIHCEIRNLKNELIRRGQFKGCIIQMRLVNLTTGEYQIHFSTSTGIECVKTFKKMELYNLDLKIEA